jgi:hypothetical protein
MGLFEGNVQKNVYPHAPTFPSNRTISPLKQPLFNTTRGGCRGQQGMGSGSAGDGLSNNHVISCCSPTARFRTRWVNVHLPFARGAGCCGGGGCAGGCAPRRASSTPRRSATAASPRPRRGRRE